MPHCLHKRNRTLDWSIVLVFFILLAMAPLRANSSCAPQKSDTIIVEGIAKKYRVGEPISFSVKNLTPDTLWVGPFELLTFVEEDAEWFDLVFDLLNENCAAKYGKTVVQVSPNTSFRVIWNPKTVASKCFNYRTNTGLFKIRIGWFENVESRDHFILKTDPFEISP